MGKKSLPNKEMDSSEKFEVVYTSHHPLIYRFMFWRTKDEMLAQDLTSHVFEKAWRTRKSFTSGSAKTWLFRIARTTLIDYWRKKKDVSDDGEIIDQAISNATELDEALDRTFEHDELQNALARLPQIMYDIVHLRFVIGLSTRETAKQLKLSEANVRVIQYRALQKLRKYLHGRI